MGMGTRDVYLFKTDGNGDMIWERTFGGSDIDVGYSVCVTSDNGIVICGSTESFGSGIDDVYVIKTDIEGNMIWNKVIGDEESNWGDSVIETNDGHIVILATTGDWFDKEGGYGNRDVYLIKLDSEGHLRYDKTIGNTRNYDEGVKILETVDGGYIVAGHGDILHGNTRDVYLLRTDSDGREVWSERFGEGSFYEFGCSVCLVDDGFIVCGYNKTISPHCETEMYLLKLDFNGNLIWKRIFGGFGSDWGISICNSYDDGYLIVGQTDSYDSDLFDILIVKTNSEGYSNQNPNKPVTPNGPSSGKPRIEYSYTSSSTDMDGNQLYYLFDWGDETNSGWLGPFDSGEECQASHSWDQRDEYNIRVKARDIHGGESNWSDPLSVSMPKNKIFSIFLQLFEKSNWIFPFIKIYFNDIEV